MPLVPVNIESLSSVIKVGEMWRGKASKRWYLVQILRNSSFAAKHITTTNILYWKYFYYIKVAFCILYIHSLSVSSRQYWDEKLTSLDLSPSWLGDLNSSSDSNPTGFLPNLWLLHNYLNYPSSQVSNYEALNINIFV